MKTTPREAPSRRNERGATERPERRRALRRCEHAALSLRRAGFDHSAFGARAISVAAVCTLMVKTPPSYSFAQTLAWHASPLELRDACASTLRVLACAPSLAHIKRCMSTALSRLAAQIESQLPGLTALVGVRWVGWQVVFPIRRLIVLAVRRRRLHGFYPTQMERVAQTAHAWLQLVLALAYMVCVVYCTVDAALTLDDATRCQMRSASRPVGVAAAVALACLLTTVRLDVSCFALVTLDACASASTAVSTAAICTAAMWMRSPATPVVLSVTAASMAAHALACAEGCSARLAVLAAGTLYLFVVRACLRGVVGMAAQHFKAA